jgi:phosphatidylinositol alpha-1,6-mannosyltransferase
MANRGAKIHVLTSSLSDEDWLPYVDEIKILPDPPKKPSEILKYLADNTRILRLARSCDIIHCLAEPYAPLTYILAKLTMRPYIISGVGTYTVRPLDSNDTKRFFALALKHAEKIICISHYTQTEILRRLKISNTCVIPLGVNSSMYSKKDNFNQVKSERDCPILISVGAIKRRKGYQTSIQAIDLVRRKIPNLKYYIVGKIIEDFTYKEISALIEELGLKENVFFYGNIPEEQLIDLYNSSDLFILTPINVDGAFEGFGLVYLEANACGLPVIGTKNCGAEEPILDGYNGLLVPQNDPEAAAQAILKLLEDDVLRNEMRNNALERAKQMSFDRTVSEIFAVYHELLQR